MINKLNKLLLTNVPVLHPDELWVVLPLPDCEANLFVCQSGLWVYKATSTTSALAPKGVILNLIIHVLLEFS